MVFDPNFILKGIDGNEIEGHEEAVHAGKILANTLYYAQSGSQLRLHGWALKLYDRKPIDITDEDRKLILSVIDNSRMPVITAAPLIQMLNDLK